jgi:hypothetical protein
VVLNVEGQKRWQTGVRRERALALEKSTWCPKSEFETLLSEFGGEPAGPVWSWEISCKSIMFETLTLALRR